MARYEHDFMGIPADFGQDWGNRPGGLDPNYRDAYRGQPMRTDDPRRAPYVRHRLRHWEDLGGQGGLPPRERLSRTFDEAGGGLEGYCGVCCL